MMAASRSLQQSISMKGLMGQMTLSWQQVLVSALVMLVLGSAVAVTYVRCSERQLVSQQQSLLQQRQQLQVQWGQLLLERSTWSNPVHIQAVADNEGMISPVQKSIVMVRM